DHEADERERFGEGDAEEHRGADHAGRFGLTGHGLDGLTDEEADADAGADGRQAVGETGADGGVGLLLLVAGELRGEVGDCFHVVLVLLCWSWLWEIGSCARAQCSGCVAPPMYTAVRMVKM